jgi:hypothetical protein
MTAPPSGFFPENRFPRMFFLTETGRVDILKFCNGPKRHERAAIQRHVAATPMQTLPSAVPL